MRVSVKLGYTLNAGNYESFRIDLGVDDNARVINGAVESKDELLDRVYGFVETQLMEKVNDARKALE